MPRANRRRGAAYDIEGEAVAEVIDAFRAVTSTDQQAALIADLSAFLTKHSETIEDDFEAIFQPDIIPSALSESTRAFLEEIQSLLRPS
jgi:uncharacterized FlgJ-related protein